MQKEIFTHCYLLNLMLMESQVKLCSLENVYGASQRKQNCSIVLNN